MAEALGDIQQTPHLSEQTHIAILEAAEETYAVLAARYEHPIVAVHRVGLCVPATELMEKNLRERGHTARQTRGFGLFHFYVELSSEQTEDRVLVDPTWQQLLPQMHRRKLEMPKVLIGTGDEITAAARSHGVRGYELGVYRPRAMKFPRTTAL